MSPTDIPSPSKLEQEESWPSVDILIPFHRIDSFLIDAITSAQASEEVIVRVIAINDTQQETSKKAIGLRETDLLVESEFKGSLGAVTTGLGYCEAEFVAFLDSDDLQDEKRLKNQIELMQETGADVSSCDLQKFSGSLIRNQVKSISGVAPNFKAPEIKLIFGAHGADSSLVLRLSVVKNNLNLRSHLPSQLSDYPWLLLIILGNAKYAHLQKASYFYRTHSLQISRASNLNDVWGSIYPVWLKFFNAYIEVENDIQSDFSLLIAFPSSLSKISKNELRVLRNIKKHIINNDLLENRKDRVKFKKLIGIRDVIGRRGRTINVIWIGPILCFQIIRSKMNGNLARRNSR